MIRILFSDNKQAGLQLTLARIAGPILSYAAGGAGGVFAPALSAGAVLGAWIAELCHLTANNANIIILAGMVAFLTGITRSPFTSAILVLEMTDRHNVIFHLMAAAMIANLVAKLVDVRSFYDMLSHRIELQMGLQPVNSASDPIPDSHENEG
jgi:H+/Cl- antiporter ClcA